MIEIVETTSRDRPAVRGVHVSAFGAGEGETIAGLVDALFKDPTAEPITSLMAREGDEAVGHVLFTGVTIPDAGRPVSARILCPLAVRPGAQRRGVGTRLVKEGLAILAESGCELVFVLGYSEYYTRFGFGPAGRQGLSSPYPIHEKNADAWMVLELCAGTAGAVRGTVRCADALNRPEYWCE